LEIERANALLIVECDRRATNPPPTPTICSNTSNQNFKIAILFNIVERVGNYVSEENNPHTAHRARVESYALWAYKVYIEMMIA